MPNQNLADEINHYNSAVEKWVALIKLANFTSDEIKSAFSTNSAVYKACIKEGLIEPPEKIAGR